MQISRRVTAVSSGVTMDFVFQTGGVAMVLPTALTIPMKPIALSSDARITSSFALKDLPLADRNALSARNCAMAIVIVPTLPTKKLNAVSQENLIIRFSVSLCNLRIFEMGRE